MSVLVTGATGFLGGALVERLIAAGQSGIRCLVRPVSRTARLEELARRYPEARIELFPGTLASVPEAARALDGVQCVYHLAAAASGSPADIFLNSVVASRNLLEAMVDRPPVRVVLVSSFGVYGVSDLPPRALVSEETPLEPHPERRDAYSYAKWRQEKLFREYHERYRFPLVVLRPGVIYGAGGTAISARVGISAMGRFLNFGGGNVLPLTYVENCAEAIVVAGRDAPSGAVYNVVDDDLPTCRAYLREYCRQVRPLKSVRVPYPALQLLSRCVEGYSRRSGGQLPPFLTPYKSAAVWKGNRFTNERLKSLGWRQLVPTPEAMRRTFAALRASEMPS